MRHVGTCGEFQVAQIVAKNMHMNRAVVDAVIIGQALAWRSRCAALETGLRGAVQMAAEAERAVWSEIRGAA